MEKETKHDVESLNHDPIWLKTIIIEIDKFLINHEYINFFMQIYMQWRKEDGSTSSFQKFIILCLPRFEKWICRNSSYILNPKQRLRVLCAVIEKRLLPFDQMHEKIRFLNLTNVNDPYQFAEVE